MEDATRTNHEAPPAMAATITAARLVAMPAWTISRRMLALVSLFNLADSSRYANFVSFVGADKEKSGGDGVGKGANGDWIAVPGPDGKWCGFQPDMDDSPDSDDNVDGDGRNAKAKDLSNADGIALPDVCESE